MLEIINNLKPFIENCYRRISVREYAKIIGVSPPTASKILASYYAEGLLLKETYKNYLLFYANRDNSDFIDLSRMYWRQKLAEVIKFLEKNLTDPTIILFGSLPKAETKEDSDIDIAVFAKIKDIDVEIFEKKLKRKIQIFWFDSFSRIRNTELANNILNGYLLYGRIYP